MAFKPVIKPTLSNLNTRSGPKKDKQYHFQYWADGFDLDWDLDEDEYSAKSDYYLDKVMQLAALRRATANFVRILTGSDTIRVQYSSGKDSYTTGEVVVISAEDDPKKFDKTVATALHEAAHCKLTDFNFLTIALRQIPQRFLPPEWWGESAALINAADFILNVIEDRRIDSFVYRTAVGYRPYYDVLYRELWNSKEVSKALRLKPEWRRRTWEAYISRILNISNPVAWETRHLLPGMEEIYQIMDLPNIQRLDDEQMHYRNYSMTETRTVNRKSGKTARVTVPSYRAMPDYMFEVIPRPTGWSGSYNQIPMVIRDEYIPEQWRMVLKILKIIRDNVLAGDSMPPQTGPQAPQPKESNDPNGLPNLDLDTAPVPGAPSDDPAEPQDGGPDGQDSEAAEGDTPASPGGEAPPANGKKRLTKAERDAVVNDKKLSKEMDVIRDFVKGNQHKKNIDAKIEADVRAMEDAAASIKKVGNSAIGHGRVLVTEKINDAVLTADWFAFCHKSFEGVAETEPIPTQVAAIQAGIRMGQILAHRLQVRNEQTVTKFPNQPSGHIDRRVLARLGMELENVFSRSVQDQYKPVVIHLSVDASGSMFGESWWKATTVATALSFAATKINNLEVVVSIRGQAKGDRGLAHIAIVHDSRKQSFAHFRRYMSVLSPDGATPEGLCFEAILEMIQADAADHSMFFLNISDGEPAFTASPIGKSKKRSRSWRRWPGSPPVSTEPEEEGIYYSGETAWAHTRHQINKMREVGVRILSYFVFRPKGKYDNSAQEEKSRGAFKTMYGEDASFINVSEVTGIVQTMNKLLLKKG